MRGAGDFLPLGTLGIEGSYLHTAVRVELIGQLYARDEGDLLRICLASRKDAETGQLDRFSFLINDVTYIFRKGAPEPVQDY